MGPGNEDAPYLDPDWQCWALVIDPVNGARADLLFEMHEWARARADAKQREGHAVVHSGNYPLADVIADLGRNWFESSIAYMAALAMLRRPKTIGLWGVHMASASEYAHQRPNLCWLLGQAEARGIRVHIPGGCDLLSYTHHEMRYPKRYGYQG